MARFLEISIRIQESTTTENEPPGLASRMFRVRALKNRTVLGRPNIQAMGTSILRQPIECQPAGQAANRWLGAADNRS